MDEFNDTGFTETESGQLSMFENPSDSEITPETDNFTEDTDNLSGDVSAANDDTQLSGQQDMFEEDTQSDLEKVNHPNMTLEEVQELQGVREDENGNLKTTGEGTGNDAFKDSLPEDIELNNEGKIEPDGDRIEPGATMSHDEFEAEQDRLEADINGSARAKFAGMEDTEEIPEDTSPTEQGPRVIQKEK